MSNTQSAAGPWDNSHVSGESFFWHRLTHAMRQRGLLGHRVTLGQVAKFAGTGETAVSKWRRGAGMPDSNRLADMAKKLGVSVNWLWTGQGEMSVTQKEDEAFKELLTLFLSLSDTQRQQLKVSAEIMLELSKRQNTKPKK